MGSRLVLTVMACAWLVFAGSKKVPSARGENEDVEISASLLPDRESIQQTIGSDLGGHYVVIDVKLAPKYEKEIPVQRDDFLLRTDKDGEKSTPFAPSQVAGSGVLVISRSTSGGGIMGDNNGPIIGGYPGTTDRPRRLGGDGGGFGSTASTTSTQAAARSDSKAKENPLLAALEQKILPDRKTGEPITGLLYFPLGKQKTKDLELIYRGPGGKISLRFK